MLDVNIWLPNVRFAENFVPNALDLKRYDVLPIEAFWNIIMEEELFVDSGWDHVFREAKQEIPIAYYDKLFVSLITLPIKTK